MTREKLISIYILFFTCLVIVNISLNTFSTNQSSLSCTIHILSSHKVKFEPDLSESDILKGYKTLSGETTLKIVCPRNSWVVIPNVKYNTAIRENRPLNLPKREMEDGLISFKAKRSENWVKSGGIITKGRSTNQSGVRVKVNYRLNLEYLEKITKNEKNIVGDYFFLVSYELTQKKWGGLK